MSDEALQMRVMADGLDKVVLLTRVIDVAPLSPAHAVRLDEIAQRLDDCAGDFRLLADEIEL